jgi:hypothetical protein
MKTLFGTWLLLGWAGALQARPQQLELKIEVLVYNYAGVPSEPLARAEREAGRIYDHAGIQTEWLDCPLTPQEAAAYPACQLPASPTRLALRIFPRNLAKQLGLSPGAFGSALSPKDGSYGMIAQVCAECVEELAHTHTAEFAVILGAVMAHELGHLLLGMNSHAPTGLMSGFWNKKELDTIAAGRLLFAPREADRMRRQVFARQGRDASANNRKSPAAVVKGP